MSVPYYGDFAEDDTVLIPFNTFSSNDPSASVTVSTLIASDIKVHKDGGDTEIATDGATIAIDFGSRTGAHLITIDTSAHSDYATGSEYAVMVEGATVDGGNITAWVGAFSIERAGGALALLKTVDGKIDTIDGIVDSILTDTGTTLDGKIDTIDGIVDDILTDTGTTLDGKIDTIDGNVDTILTDTADMQPRVVAIEVDTGTTLQGELDGIQADTEDLQTQIGTAGDGLTAVVWNAAWDAEVQSECTDALNAYDPPTKAEMDTGHGLLATEAKQDTIDGIVDTILVDTADMQPRVAAIEVDTGTTLDGKIDTIDGIVDAIVADTGTDGVVVAGASKTGYTLSDAGVDAVFDRNASISISFEVLIERIYQMINNEMLVNEGTGVVGLEPIGLGADIASGQVDSDSGTTTRTELTWT